MITDGYDRCRQRKLPLMPSLEQKLYLDDSDKDLRRDIRAMGMMVVGAWVRKWRYGRRDHVCMFLVSLFSSSLLWISARYKWRRHGFLPPGTGGGVSPGAGSAERLTCAVPISTGTYWFVRVPTWNVCLIASFLSFPCTWVCSAGGLLLKRGMM